MRVRNEINQFETRRDDRRLYLCHLLEGTSDLLGGPKAVFIGLCISPKLPLNPIFTSSSLGAVLDSRTVDDSVEFSEDNLLSRWLSTKSVVCIFFRH